MRQFAEKTIYEHHVILFCSPSVFLCLRTRSISLRLPQDFILIKKIT